jgi:hypothetical protein
MSVNSRVSKEVIASHAMDLYNDIQKFREIVEGMGINTKETAPSFDRSVYTKTVDDVLKEI